MRIIINLLNWLKQKIRDECGFTYAETNGIVVLLLVTSMLLATPFFLSWYSKSYHHPQYAIDIKVLNSTLAKLQAQKNQKVNPHRTQHHSKSNPHIGTAQPPTSLHDVNLIKPTVSHPKQQTKKSPPFYKAFDINTATLQELQTLPGIGEKLATRILKYKNQLGGFVHKLQYQEVYGIGEMALKHLMLYGYIASNFQPQQLSINQADFKTLLRHPYLSYEQVKKIIQYRERQGAFKHLEELEQQELIDRYTFDRLGAYLRL